jgi:hypothetical protein
MDLLLQQETIKEFIKNNYGDYLDAYSLSLPQITTEILDFDKFKSSFTVFLDFNKINFEDSDDCGDIERLNITIFLAVRNDTIDNLRKKLLNATSAFINMRKSDNSFGTAMRSKVNNIDFYNFAATGTQYINIAAIDIDLFIDE